MHFAAYHFDGQTESLQADYERMMTTFPAADIVLNLSVAREGGITVYDVCRTQEEFEAFSTSGDFVSALEAAGLPTPRIEALGDIRATHGTTIAATI